MLVNVSFKKVVLDPLRELFKKCNIVWVLKPDTSIVLPSLSKVLLDFDHELWLNWLSVVKSLNKSKELGEFIAFVYLLVEFSDLLYDLDEISHDVREDGNSEH